MSQEKYAISPLKRWVQRVLIEIDEAQKVTGDETLEQEARNYLDWVKSFLQALDGSVFPVLYHSDEAPSLFEKGLMGVALAKFVNVKSHILEPLDSEDSPFPANHPMLVDFIRRLLVLDKEIPEGLDALTPVFCKKTSETCSVRRSELPQLEGLLETVKAKMFYLPDLRKHLLAQYQEGVIQFNMLNEAVTLQCMINEHLESNAGKLNQLQGQLDALASITSPHEALNAIRVCEEQFDALNADFRAQADNYSPTLQATSSEIPVCSSSSSSSSTTVSASARMPAYYVNFGTEGSMEVMPVTSMLFKNACESLERLQRLREVLSSKASPVYDRLFEDWKDAQNHAPSSSDIETARVCAQTRLQSLRQIIMQIHQFPDEHKSRNLEKAQEEERLLMRGLRELDKQLQEREHAAFQDALANLKPEAVEGMLENVRQKLASLEERRAAIEASIQDIEAQQREATARLQAIKSPVALPKGYRNKVKRALVAMELPHDKFSINHALTAAGFMQLQAALDAKIQTLVASIHARSMELLGIEGGIRQHHIDAINSKTRLFEDVVNELQHATQVPYDAIAACFATYKGPSFDKESDDGYAKFLELLEPLEASTKEKVIRPTVLTTIMHGNNFSRQAMDPLTNEVKRAHEQLTQEKRALQAALSEQQVSQETVRRLHGHLSGLDKINRVPAELQARAERANLQQSHNLLQARLEDEQQALSANREEAKILVENERLLETFVVFHEQLHGVITADLLQAFEVHATQAREHDLGALHSTLLELGRRNQSVVLPGSTESFQNPPDRTVATIEGPGNEGDKSSTAEAERDSHVKMSALFPGDCEDGAGDCSQVKEIKPFDEISSVVSNYIQSIPTEHRNFANQLRILVTQIERLYRHARALNRLSTSTTPGAEAMDFAKNLMNHVAALTERSGQKCPTADDFRKFSTGFNTCLNQPPESIGNHRGALWKRILLNIALCIPLLFRCLFAPCTSGGFRFFGQNTKRQDILEDIQEAANTITREYS
ncbi:hypothetical protein Lgee_2104 [Legionella geestiana]|uniref:Uncharacterized protein n=1 Tax=Legionella geestiana TaxID=45065 RepID=A0A0W0TNN1_9GAMM|nr:hypothetical protein [Legionella geestiana]KTC97133.1 hypothetical protein Lgee_2104 [Legionella geestiana]QBS11487.1 hypothetical protein E4T54_01310 [Legionella geestiana]STX53849.1 Uncharacterized conserved protein [Legionella geestiana]